MSFKVSAPVPLNHEQGKEGSYSEIKLVRNALGISEVLLVPPELEAEAEADVDGA
jgi:hypothetical protein